MIGCCSLKFRRERQKQLAAEQIIGAVGICRAAGDDVRVDDRRILVEHIIGAGANLQDLVDVPRGLEVQIIIRTGFSSCNSRKRRTSKNAAWDPRCCCPELPHR
jgi:hypothetical protein